MLNIKKIIHLLEMPIIINKCKPLSNILAYRDKGTGEPCAKHNKPIPFLICLSIQLRFTSDDNEGAFTPTGSVGNNIHFEINSY